jgi:uncharacterized protein
MSQAGVIDGLHFARAALQKRGSVGMEQLLRLSQMRCSTQGLEYHLSGGTANNGKPCLRISVRGYVQLECQRCLGPLQAPVVIDAELQFAGSLSEISEADDEIDRVLASRHMDVERLVEDEVILALPMVPRHEACAHHPVI